MEIAVPASSPRLDTSLHIHATDGNGKLLIDDETGGPVHIAQDLNTGKWYRKVADSMPWNGPKKKTHLQLYIDMGGVHVAHEQEKFRGVWAPVVADVPAPSTKKSDDGKNKN